MQRALRFLIPYYWGVQAASLQNFENETLELFLFVADLKIGMSTHRKQGKGKQKIWNFVDAILLYVISALHTYIISYYNLWLGFTI